MKKLIGLFAVLFCLNGVAQSVMTGSGDTVTNTATKTNYLKMSGAFKKVTIQTLITKISGTVAGAVTVQGSLDGTNYNTVDSVLYSNKKIYVSANTTGVQSTIFIVNDSPYLYYRVTYTGVGTMSASIYSYILGRNY